MQIWQITVGGGYGSFVFVGSENEAEQTRANKARWEQAVATKKLLSLGALTQLIKTTWDGDLLSEFDRNELVEAGLAQKAHGWNFLTAKGVGALVDVGVLKS